MKTLGILSICLQMCIFFYLHDVVQPQSTTTPSSSDNSVRLPPAITVNPPQTQYFSITTPLTGNNNLAVTINCGAIGTPTPAYSWYKNGAPLTIDGSHITQQNQGTIQIPSPQSGDQGYYQCIATNTWGTSASVTCFLQLATLQSFTSGSTVSTAVNVGASLTMPCNPPASVPTASYSWATAPNPNSTNPTPVPLSDRITVDLQGNLLFSNVVIGDATTGNTVYLCNVKNSQLGITLSGSYTKLFVTAGTVTNSAPSAVSTITQSPAQAVAGQDISLFCDFNGYPTPQVTWTTPLPAGRYNLSNSNTLLTIYNVQQSDAITYTCQGANSNGQTATANIQVNVNVPPTFQSTANQPNNVNATNGQSVSFICLAQAIPAAQIVWYQNGRSLSPSSLPSKFSISSDLTNLTISNVCKVCADGNSDLQVIQCNISNIYGYAYAQGYLNVLDATIITTPPINQSLVSYTIMTFSCEATTDPSTSVSITWTFNGQNITYNNYIYTDSSGSLHINTNTAPGGGSGYIGTFTCEASNGFSSAFASAQLLPAIPVVQSAATYWYIFLIFGLLLLLLLLFLCWWCTKNNEGETYPVDEQEKKNGNDPEQEVRDKDFQAFQRPEKEQQAQPVGNLNAYNSMNFGSDANDGSLEGYGNFDAGRFNEEGSFIGQYAGEPNPLHTQPQLAPMEGDEYQNDRGYSRMETPVVSARPGVAPDQLDHPDFGAGNPGDYFGNPRNFDGTRSHENLDEEWQGGPGRDYDNNPGRDYDNNPPSFHEDYDQDKAGYRSPDNLGGPMGFPPPPPPIPTRPSRQSLMKDADPTPYYSGENPMFDAQVTITGPLGNQVVFSSNRNLNQNGQEYLEEDPHQDIRDPGDVHMSYHSLDQKLNSYGDASVV